MRNDRITSVVGLFAIGWLGEFAKSFMDISPMIIAFLQIVSLLIGIPLGTIKLINYIKNKRSNK